MPQTFTMSEPLAEDEKQVELIAAMAKNEQDPEQCNEETGRYNREFLFNIRDLEQLCSFTECPLEPQQLKEFGLCRSLPTTKLVPHAWDTTYMSEITLGYRGPAWYKTRVRHIQTQQVKVTKIEQNLEQCNEEIGWYNREFIYAIGYLQKNYTCSSKCHLKSQLKELGVWSTSSGRGTFEQINHNKPAASVEEVVESPIYSMMHEELLKPLHKTDHPWKLEKINDDSDDAKKELLIRQVRALLNKITPTTEKSLTKEFLEYRVYTSPALTEVVTIMADIVSKEPRFSELFSRLVENQCTDERANTGADRSVFLHALLCILSETLNFEKQIDSPESLRELRSRKFGCVKFIGHLFVRSLVPMGIFMYFAIYPLGSVALPPHMRDEESIECLLRLLSIIGARLHDIVRASDKAAATEDAESVSLFWNLLPRARNSCREESEAALPFFSSMSLCTAYLWQTFPLFHSIFYELHRVKPFVSSRIRCLIMNLEEQRASGWKATRKTEQEPVTLDQIKKDIDREKRSKIRPLARMQ